MKKHVIWLRKHKACPEVIEWAKQFDSLQETWNACNRIDWLFWFINQTEVNYDKELRLFACWCIRQVWHLLKDDRSKNAVIVAEKFAVGKASKEELTVAWDDAWVATRDAEGAAGIAAWAAWDTWAAEGVATRDAARATARVATREAAWATAREKQCMKLKEMIVPDF